MNLKNLFEEVGTGLNGLFHVVFGALLIITGIIALFIPLIPGILIIAAGLYVIGGHKLINKMKFFFIKKK